MDILKNVPVYIIPLLILLIIGYGFAAIRDVYSAFTEGARQGLHLVVEILPALVGLMVAVSMLRASGAIELLAHSLAPVLSFVGLPAPVLPLVLLRPISGSASLGIVGDIFKNYGPDSYAGKVASVVMGSTETTFYTIAVYFGAVGIKDIRHTVTAALAADGVGMLVGIIICKLFFS